MRALYLLPAAFIMGIEGFDLFAPYLIALLALAYLIWRLRRRARVMPIAVLVGADGLASPRAIEAFPEA